MTAIFDIAKRAPEVPCRVWCVACASWHKITYAPYLENADYSHWTAGVDGPEPMNPHMAEELARAKAAPEVADPDLNAVPAPQPATPQIKEDELGAADENARAEWEDGEGAECETTSGIWHAALEYERKRVANLTPFLAKPAKEEPRIVRYLDASEYCPHGLSWAQHCEKCASPAPLAKPADGARDGAEEAAAEYLHRYTPFARRDANYEVAHKNLVSIIRKHSTRSPQREERG